MMTIVIDTPAGKLELASETITPHLGSLYLSCPGCEELKPVRAFGFRTSRSGVFSNNAFCSSCRARAKKH